MQLLQEFKERVDETLEYNPSLKIVSTITKLQKQDIEIFSMWASPTTHSS